MTVYAAHVFDLDGVVRDFTAGDAGPGIEAALGLPRGHLAATAFRPELLEPTITGRQTFEQWYAAICLALESDAREPALVSQHMEAWRAHRGAPINSTVFHIESLRASGARTFVFTNGTDTIPDELRLLGLDHLFDAALNSAVLGFAKPDPAAYAAAHASIEEHLGASVEPRQVWFTDDRSENVAAAREFGWDAVLFTLLSQDEQTGA